VEMKGEDSRRPAAEFSFQRLLNKVTVFTYGFFLLFLFRNNVIQAYIHERYRFLTLAASLLLIGAAVLYSAVESHGGEHGRNCGHDHGQTNGAGSWKALVLNLFLLAPVVWAFFTPTSLLGASDRMMGQRMVIQGGGSGRFPANALSAPGPGDIKLEFPAPSEEGGTVERRYTALNLMELMTILEGSGDTYEGDRVALQGFVYRPDDGLGNFELARYVVICCVVHAQAVSIPVIEEDIAGENPELEEEQWVKVMGTIGVKNDDKGGEDMKYFIKAEKIEATDPPADPYINKWYPKKPFRF